MDRATNRANQKKHQRQLNCWRTSTTLLWRKHTTKSAAVTFAATYWSSSRDSPKAIDCRRKQKSPGDPPSGANLVRMASPGRDGPSPAFNRIARPVPVESRLLPAVRRLAVTQTVSCLTAVDIACAGRAVTYRLDARSSTPARLRGCYIRDQR